MKRKDFERSVDIVLLKRSIIIIEMLDEISIKDGRPPPPLYLVLSAAERVPRPKIDGLYWIGLGMSPLYCTVPHHKLTLVCL